MHTAGRRARRVVEESRDRLAATLGSRPSEVIFTSGGTESDNLAVQGVFAAQRDADPSRVRLLVSAIEHHAILDCVEALTKRHGAQVSWIEPDADGVIHPSAVEMVMADDPSSVALVSVMWANNEVGAVQDMPGIAALAHEHGIPVHTDAVQAFGHVPVDFAGSGADLMTVTGTRSADRSAPARW